MERARKSPWRDGGTTLLLTLGITRIIEKEILDVSVWGSPDGRQWKHLAAFPRKSYCGTYSMVLDLAGIPASDIFARSGRWADGTGGPKPLFGFYLQAEDVKVRHAGAA